MNIRSCNYAVKDVISQFHIHSLLLSAVKITTMLSEHYVIFIDLAITKSYNRDNKKIYSIFFLIYHVERFPMNEILKEKISESLSAVVPITLIVLALSVFVVPLETGTMAMFVVGAIMLIFGMALFQLGAETAMTPLGEGTGVQLTKLHKYILVIIVSAVMGFIITIAEPDLQALAQQVLAAVQSSTAGESVQKKLQAFGD